jgi:alpha-L-fucosidase 2
MKAHLTSSLLLFYFISVKAAPPGFPSSGNGLWYTSEGDPDAWETTALLIGNGFLAGKLEHHQANSNLIGVFVLSCH